MHRVGSAALVVLFVAGCGSSSHVAVQSSGSTSSSAAPSSATTAAPTTTSSGVPDLGPHPHFDTPEAAMKYLAAAWNAKDLTAEKHVTDPGARDELDAMRSEATNLRFDRCERRQNDREDLGDYTCTFKHDYPPNTSTTIAGGIGEAVVLVGPADTPGWYMTVFEHCG